MDAYSSISMSLEKGNFFLRWKIGLVIPACQEQEHVSWESQKSGHII